MQPGRRCGPKSDTVVGSLRLQVLPLLTAVVLLTTPAGLLAQGSQADYQRAATLEQRTRDRVFRSRIDPQWLEGNTSFWYRVKTGRESHQFVWVDAAAGIREPAFDHRRLATSLAAQTQREVQPQRLPFRSIAWEDSQRRWLKFSAFNRSWRCDTSSYKLEVSGAGTAKSEGLPPQQRIRRSAGRGPEVYVQFMNRTSSQVELFWVQSDGERTSYGTIEAGAEKRQHTFGGHAWLLVDRENQPVAAFVAGDVDAAAVIDGQHRPRSAPERTRGRPRNSNQTPGQSPDGKWQALIEGHNVVLRSVEDDSRVALTTDGSAEQAYQKRMYWSPDSAFLAVLRVKRAEQRSINLIESSPRDQLQPRLHTLEYSKPGDQLDEHAPVLFDIQNSSRVEIDARLFANPWRLSEFRWNEQSTEFMFLFNQRGHQVLRVIGIHAPGGRVRAIVDEVSETFVDYAYKHYQRFVNQGSQLIWMSERDGFNHLYLYDVKTGRMVRQLTRGNWVVRGVERVDEQQGVIWFRASGVYPEQDPYYLHLCRVQLDGTGFQVVTSSDGTHEWEFSPDQRYLIARWSRVDHPPVTELRDASTGELVCELERADWSELLKSGWRPPERFTAMGRDDRTPIYGIVIKPSNFDPSRRYPVIEKIYAGPHSAFVPKAFNRQVREHALAELGFIVVQIDGMGTSHRDKAFHDVSWKNLGDSGFPDRIRWLRAAADEFPQMDLERLGIFGGSAGGQSALRAMLAHGDFYRAAVADCGCHDNRMDKVWWNELWMSWPIGPHYALQSNVTQAHRLRGPLLLIVGELDRNVDPASTMQVVDALVKADRDFDLLVMPGTGHGAAETPYGRRRRQDFFVRHLLARQPRWTTSESAVD